MVEALPDGPGLYVVGTPIGNLEDITLRALRVLGAVDLIVSEDTRKTGILLKRYDITTSQKSYRIHRIEPDTQLVLERLRAGQRVALCTDAGTPSVSDPGTYLIRRVREEMPDLTVTPVPGPSALTTALSVCGWQTNPALYAGFLSPKSGRRRSFLEKQKDFDGIIVLFESVHRVEKLVADIREILPRRDIFIAREMTKLYEEFRVLPADSPLTGDFLTKKGEFTLILGPERSDPV